jgi:YaiO family outer membrane protein
MNKGRTLSGILAIALAFPLWFGAAWGQDDVKGRAAAAIRSGDHEAAIRLCLDGLRLDHADYELNFLLGRAYAYSGRWKEALQVFNDLALAHPENTDVLLFRGRVRAWSREYEAAEEEYREVLRLSPGNGEALTGLAEIASWRGDYATALALYARVREKEPADADIHMRIGRVHLWKGEYDRARESLAKAVSLEPGNKEYRRMLQGAAPRFRDHYEVRTEYQVESFSDGRKDYIDRKLALQLRLSSLGPLVLRASAMDRFEARDTQYGFEFYPRLWSRAYAFVEADYSPQHRYLPKTSFLAEVYQAVSSGWDLSFGYRRMNFTSHPADICLGSVGRYFGQNIAFLRWYFTPGGEGEAFSWTLNLRRYLSDTSYLFAAYGRGSRPFDLVSIDDYSVARSWVFFTGLDWTFRQRVRVQLTYSHRDEGRMRRNLFFAAAGYRW